MAIDYHVDLFTPRDVRGWAFSRTGGSVRVQVWSGDRCLGETVASEPRPDVAAAFGDIPQSLNSGFGVNFVLASQAPFAELRVCLVSQDESGRAVESIDAVRAEFLTGEGRRSVAERPVHAPLLSPFPRPVAELVAALWHDAPVHSHVEADQQSVVDKVLLLAAQPVNEELRAVLDYVRYLREAWAHFEFVRRYFPRTNEKRTATDKDYSCMPNSPEELFTIAHHLYVVKSHGGTGAFAEFGCYKGYSTSMLSYACRLLDLPMHVFESFAGLPPSDSQAYRPGEFAGSLAEVKAHVQAYGAPEMVTFHPGYFSDSLPSFDMPRLITLWMDVDLESSATDVMTVFGRIDPLGSVFSHECEPRYFEGDRIVAPRDPNTVVGPITDAFDRTGAAARGRYLHGCTGAFWRRQDGIPVLAEAPLRRLLAGI